MSEFLEILSEGALEELKQVQAIVKTLANDIKSINNFKPSSTPSGADKGSLALAEAYKKREEQMDKARVALQKLSDAEAKAEAQKKAQMAAMFTAQEKANKKIEEQQRAYTELLARQKAATLALRDLVVETGKESVATKKLQKELNALNAELLQAEQASKKYAMGASSLATPVLLYAEAQKKATQATKEANAERSKANAMISKQMTGQMVESVNAIGKPSESLKRMGDYYRELEKETAETAKGALANQNLNRAYVQLTANREKAKNKLQDLIASERASSAEIRKAQKEFDVLNKKVAAADKAVGRFSDANRKINGLASSVGNLMTAFGVGTGLYLAVDIAKNIFNTTLSLQEMDLSLNAVSGSLKKFEENSAFLKRISFAYGGNIEKLTHSFVQFYASAKDKIAEREIKNIFESITKSGAFLGLSMERQERGFLALQQMMSKTTVMAEELRGQLSESLPNAVGTMTKAYQNLHPEMKVTEKFFLEQVKAGKVLSAEILPEYAKQLEISLGIENTEKINTARVAIGRLKLAWIQLIKAVTESNLGSITGQTFAGMSIIGTALLDKIKRGFQNVGQLASESMQKGMEEGRESAEKGIYDETIDKRLNKAREQIKKAQKEYLAENLALQANQRKLRFTPKTAVNEQIIKDLEQQIEQGSNIVGFWKGYVEQSAEIIKELKSPKVGAEATTTKAQIEAEKREREKRLKSIEEANKLEYDLKMSNLEVQKQLAQDEIDLANAITQNKEIQYQDVIDATKYYNGVLIAIEKAKYDEEVRLAGENSKEKEIAYNKWFISTLKLSKEMAESLLKVTKDFAKEGNDVAKQMLSDIEENAKAFEDIDKRMTDRKIKNDKDKLESQRRAFNEFMGGLADKSGFKETFDLLGQINPETGKTIMGDLLDTDDKGEKAKAYFLAVSTVAQDAMNAIDQADEERYQRRLARLEKEKEVALSFAGDSAAAKAKIEADFDKKKKALEIKEFKRKQKMTIANIAIDTAQAAMASWAKTGFPWAAAAAIAMGAIQIGIVAAQKPPEYWTGTDNAEAGLAWSNERGAEIITDKNDRIKDFGDNKGARLTMMAKGDKVYTASETKKIMFNSELNNLLTDNGIKDAKIEIVNKGLTVEEMDLVLAKHLGNRTVQSINFDKNGFSAYVSKNGNITRDNYSRGSGIGQTF